MPFKRASEYNVVHASVAEASLSESNESSCQLYSLSYIRFFRMPGALPNNAVYLASVCVEAVMFARVRHVAMCTSSDAIVCSI